MTFTPEQIAFLEDRIGNPLFAIETNLDILKGKARDNHNGMMSEEMEVLLSIQDSLKKLKDIKKSFIEKTLKDMLHEAVNSWDDDNGSEVR